PPLPYTTLCRSRISHLGDHAPSSDWPHTRTTLLVTDDEAGLAKNAMVSATSTGRPPCCIEFMRRPASRVANGIAAVICVSMKPGDTALTVTFCEASSAEAPLTKPITPALEAA